MCGSSFPVSMATSALSPLRRRFKWTNSFVPDLVQKNVFFGRPFAAVRVFRGDMADVAIDTGKLDPHIAEFCVHRDRFTRQSSTLRGISACAKGSRLGKGQRY